MFIGHYGAAFAAKPAQKPIPLWLLFIAVQWLDVVWSALIMLGVEKMRIVKGFTASNSMDLYYMPYTHGLIGALALSVLLGGLSALFFRERRAAVTAVVAGAVFSHWLLDLVVHVPDLPLLGDSLKVGFGLWQHPWVSQPLELATLFLGATIYARFVPSRTRLGNLVLWCFVALMVGVHVYAAMAADATTPVAQAQQALLAYLVLAAVSGLVDWARGTSGQGSSAGSRDRPAGHPITA
jgi:hypothetical protein